LHIFILIYFQINLKVKQILFRNTCNKSYLIIIYFHSIVDYIKRFVTSVPEQTFWVAFEWHCGWWCWPTTISQVTFSFSLTWDIFVFFVNLWHCASLMPPKFYPTHCTPDRAIFRNFKMFVSNWRFLKDNLSIHITSSHALNRGRLLHITFIFLTENYFENLFSFSVAVYVVIFPYLFIL